MKLIPLTQGKFAMVDDEDYEWLSTFMWFAYRGGRTWYAGKVREGVKNGPMASMHGLLLFGGEFVDHWDHNGLNNMKSNIRFASRSENSRNMQKPLGVYSSRFKGVSWHEARRKWSVRITTEPGCGSGPKRPWIGHYDDEISAAKAYDVAAKHYFGEFAHTNF